MKKRYDKTSEVCPATALSIPTDLPRRDFESLRLLGRLCYSNTLVGRIIARRPSSERAGTDSANRIGFIDANRPSHERDFGASFAAGRRYLS